MLLLPLHYPVYLIIPGRTINTYSFLSCPDIPVSVKNPSFLVIGKSPSQELPVYGGFVAAGTGSVKTGIQITGYRPLFGTVFRFLSCIGVNWKNQPKSYP